MVSEKWTIGIDIGGTKIIVARINDEGKVLDDHQIPTRVKEGPEEVIKDIIAEVRKLEEKVDSKPTAVGVGMAGQIVSKTGEVKFAPNLKWKNVLLQELLSKAIGVPAIVINDVRAATWAEWKYGAGKGVRNIICLMIGTGIGGGIIIDGVLINGSSNSAGELGHFPILLNGPKCSCGNFGCLEALASGWAVARTAKEAIEKNRTEEEAILKLANGDLGKLSAREVLSAASQGDPLATQIVEKAIAAIVAGSIGYVNALNPERLILAGGLGMALPNLVEIVSKGVKEKALKAATADLKVVSAALTADSVAIGAASYAYHSLEAGKSF